MEKNKLITKRKAKGFSQSMIAEKLCMDVSNYNRREKGQVRISSMEWDKLAEILEESVENLYEAEEGQMFVAKDNSTVHYQGNNHIYAVPEHLLETQRKYIEILERKVRGIKEDRDPDL
jgi:transcriptional regulator with XRE-family HTH domain